MSANGLGWDLPGGLEPYPTLPSTPYPMTGSYPITPPTMSTKKQRAVGAASGAASGASMGAFGGPIGMGIGAGVGALLGWLGSRKKKKPTDEAIQQLLQLQMQQYQSQQPLRDAVTSMAMNRLRAVYPNGMPGNSPVSGMLNYLTQKR